MTKTTRTLLTERDHERIRKRAETVFNCVHYEIAISPEGDLEFVLEPSVRHANVVDSASLANLLSWLKDYRYVPKDTMTMWVGLRDNRMLIWCSANLSWEL